MSTTELKVTKWAAQHTAGHETHGQTAIYNETTGKDVAIVYDGNAHAELIVRAVNSHADMLEALEAARDELMYYHAEAQKKAFVIGQVALKSSTLLAIEAAIAKARGGAA